MIHDEATHDELYNIALELDIEGRSQMSKAELEQAIREERQMDSYELYVEVDNSHTDRATRRDQLREAVETVDGVSHVEIRSV